MLYFVDIFMVPRLNIHIFQAKCVERLPVLENELRQVYAEANGRLETTQIGGQTTDKSFNQV